MVERQQTARRDGVEWSGGGATRQPSCGARTQRGAPCRSFTLPGRPFCMSHDPERAGDVRQARARGGAAASKLRALKARRPRLDTAAGLMAFIAALAHDTLGGRVAPDVSRAVAYALSLQLRLLEASELEQRIAVLEERAERERLTGGRQWGA